MEQQTLAIELREKTGKGAAHKIRRTGKVPGVLYGLGKHTSIAVNPITIRKYLLQKGGRNIILTLSGSGVSGRHALIKDYQVDPVTRDLVHVDLLEIDTTKKVRVTVPFHFSGKSVGVAEGGVLNIVGRTIEVRCLPTSIPKHIDVDVSALKIGDSIHLDELAMPEGIERVSPVNATLVTVVPPTKEEELQPALAPTAEPEVITEKKEAKAEGEDVGSAETEKGKEKKEKAAEKSKEKKDKEEKKK